MVKVNFVGVVNPKSAFDELRPLRARLQAMQNSCRPFHADYLVLAAAVKALDTAAFHFTHDPEYFGLKPDQSRHGQAGALPPDSPPDRR